jgi:hypothetical protein
VDFTLTSDVTEADANTFFAIYAQDPNSASPSYNIYEHYNVPDAATTDLQIQGSRFYINTIPFDTSANQKTQDFLSLQTFNGNVVDTNVR